MTKETNINSSLTKPDIMVNPFYKAVICLINFDNPLEAFAYMYSDSYYVTEEEAYNLVKTILEYYNENGQMGEKLGDFMDRISIEKFRKDVLQSLNLKEILE